MLGRIIIAAVLLACAIPASAADEQPICADRPSKSTGPCTVPARNWQIETGLLDWSHDGSGGVDAELTQWGGSLIKHGLSGNADVELGIAPLEVLSVHGGGANEHHSGFGDMFVRVKYALTRGNSPVQVALDPFVKIPTANHLLGNGKVEGGLLVPVQVPLGKSPLTLSFDPELDLLADDDGHGRHVATQQVANLGIQLNRTLNLSAEFWTAWDWASAGTTRQASADGAIAYDVRTDVQIDAGANFGLNRNTPDVELYTGFSMRF
jgi:hypothetical protein